MAEAQAGVGTHWIDHCLIAADVPGLLERFFSIIKGPDSKLHHFAYHLSDWSAILRAADIFSMDDVPIDIGPTWHGITRG